jgi:NADPH:quinone reductase-like Zn-dependent oxidoreductase
VGNHPLSALAKVLAPGGVYVMIGGPAGKWVDPLPRVVELLARSKLGSHEMKFFIAEFNQRDLMVLHDLMASGKMKSVIDKTYPLEQLREAVAYVETGRARGKVVVRID